VNVNGDAVITEGLTVPPPFSVILTVVALPLKVLPLTETIAVPQVVPTGLLRTITGRLVQPHETVKTCPAVTQPDEFFTVMMWFPLITFAKVVPLWYVPPSSLYSIPVPVGLVTLTAALPKPRVQSIVCSGTAGDKGCELITTFADGADKHPASLVRVKLYVPAGRSDIVLLVPVPVKTTVPGYLVNVHVPAAVNPSNTTLPVDKVHVGGVITPTDGGAGISGCALMTISEEATEVHPDELVTVKLWVPTDNPEIVVLVVEPFIPPGLIVHVPSGNPFNTTLPVDRVHVGRIIVPATGAAGARG